MSSRTPSGPPPPPTVARLRLRYAKRGRLRFTSSRDFQRAFERALRRAAIPVAFSAGFSPHPKVSYAGGAPTGVASEAEYLELGLAEARDPEAVRAALDAALPPGLDVLEVVPAGAGSLAERLEASVWRLELAGVAPERAAVAVERLLAADEVVVQRVRKGGLSSFDVRGAVLRLTVEDARLPAAGVAPAAVDGACAILHLVVRHCTPAVRPDDVLTGLRVVADLAPPSPARVVRLAQGPYDPSTGEVSDPLTPDRPAVGA